MALSSGFLHRTRDDFRLASSRTAHRRRENALSLHQHLLKMPHAVGRTHDAGAERRCWAKGWRASVPTSCSQGIKRT